MSTSWMSKSSTDKRRFGAFASEYSKWSQDERDLAKLGFTWAISPLKLKLAEQSLENAFGGTDPWGKISLRDRWMKDLDIRRGEGTRRIG